MRKKLSKKAFVRLKKRTAKETTNTFGPGEQAVKVPDVDGWLTRNEACDMLRISPQTLKNYESRGLLHPLHGLRKDRSDVERVMLVYNPKELAELPSRNGGGQPRVDARAPGEQAARAFELFRKGWALDEIVIELRETPERIDQLHEQWLDQTKARYVISLEAKRALEEIFGEFKSVTELVELHARWAAAQGSLTVTPRAKQIFEQMLGPFTNVAGLVELLTKKLASA